MIAATQAQEAEYTGPLATTVESLIDRALDSDCRPLRDKLYEMLGRLWVRLPRLAKKDLATLIVRAGAALADDLDAGHEPEPSEFTFCLALANLLD